MPAGEAYSRVENPKGELGYYVVADGSGTAYRYHVRSPSFINLTALEPMCLGHTIADVVGILGSLDIVLGEVDRYRSGGFRGWRTAISLWKASAARFRWS